MSIVARMSSALTRSAQRSAGMQRVVVAANAVATQRAQRIVSHLCAAHVSASVPSRSFSAAAAAQATAAPTAGASDRMTLTEKRGAVGIITLNRPKALNALCNALIREVSILQLEKT